MPSWLTYFLVGAAPVGTCTPIHSNSLAAHLKKILKVHQRVHTDEENVTNYKKMLLWKIECMFTRPQYYVVMSCLRQDPLEAILVIFGRRALIFFVWTLLEKNEKWRHFCAHAQWWSPWRRKNVEKGHLAPSNLTFLIIAIDSNGFRRMKEEGLIYKTLPQIF